MSLYCEYIINSYLENRLRLWLDIKFSKITIISFSFNQYTPVTLTLQTNQYPLCYYSSNN